MLPDVSKMASQNRRPKTSEDSEHENEAKRHCPEDNSTRKVCVYILPDRIQSKRYGIIRNSGIKNGFDMQDSYSERVTHLVTELENGDQVRQSLNLTGPFKCHVVGLQWFFDSVREGKRVAEDSYVIASSSAEPKVDHALAFDTEEFNSCIAQRKAPLNPVNNDLAEPLEFLSTYWSLMGNGPRDVNRSLAFRKACSAVRCLPFKVTHVDSVRGIKALGEGHSLRIIREVLGEGKSEEVESKRTDAHFLAIKEFAGVFGVGPVLARQWYDGGFRSVADVRARFSELKIEEERLKYGLPFHTDLKLPLVRSSADRIREIVKELVDEIKPGMTMEVTGGYRRGKKSGHDVDFLLSHPSEGAEEGVLEKLVQKLRERGLIVWARLDRASVSSDRLECCLCIFRLPLDDLKSLDPLPLSDWDSLEKEGQRSPEERGWRAVRVDLVVCPSSMYAFALLGWTGNKWYNRVLRLHATRVCGMTLSSQSLWDESQKRNLPAKTEEEIFKLLGLTYRDPSDRNF